jgi:hypothetical protein
METTDKQHIVELLDRLEPNQIGAVAKLLEVIIHDDHDLLTNEDRRAIAASREYFRQGGAGVPFEQLVANLCLTAHQPRAAA